MAYTTRTEMDTRYTAEQIRLVATGNSGTPGAAIADAVVELFITKAENLINSRLGAVYSVPFATTPAVIKDICQEIAILMMRRDRHGGVLPNVLQPQWDALMEQLEAIRKGLETIPGVARVTGTGVRNSTSDGREHVFTNSHYSSDGSRIEDDGWAGSLDGL